MSSDFKFSLSELMNATPASIAAKIMKDVPNGGNLTTSRSKGGRQDVLGVNMFLLSEVMMKIPAVNATSKVLGGFEALVSGIVGGIVGAEDVDEHSTGNQLLPDDIKKAVGLLTTSSEKFTKNYGKNVNRGDPSVYTGSKPSTMAWGGYSNGKIPLSALHKINIGGTNHYFEPNAGRQFEKLIADAKKEGVNITLNSSFRSYAAQVDVKRRKPTLAATPGKSNHGWGKAVDVNVGKKWIQQNGARYGWVWPDWARPGGSKPEDWHMEFYGVPRPPSGTSSDGKNLQRQ